MTEGSLPPRPTAPPTLTDASLVEQLRPMIREELEAAAGAGLRARALRYRETARLYGAAGVLALYAGGALVAFLVLLFAAVMPGWLAALVWAIVLGLGAAVTGHQARSRTRGDGPRGDRPRPEQAEPSAFSRR